MKDYGRQQSTVRPLDVEITQSKVFIASDISEVHEPGTEDMPGFEGFEFGLVEYDKDEYIKLQADKNSELESTLLDTQLALCDIYEMMGG